MVEIDKEQLKIMSLLANDRYNRGQSFTHEETEAYFRLLKAVFGNQEASGFLNAVLETCKKYNGQVPFNMAVTETIVMYSAVKID